MFEKLQKKIERWARHETLYNECLELTGISRKDFKEFKKRITQVMYKGYADTCEIKALTYICAIMFKPSFFASGLEKQSVSSDVLIDSLRVDFSKGYYNIETGESFG